MLRPISFSIPSSTELRVSFNKELSDTLGIENFEITSVSGNVDGLEVTKVEIQGQSVLIGTKPQVSGNFYILKLKDSDEILFSSRKGVPLINDDTSRDLYFVGIKNYNPARDRMYSKVPRLYNLENSNISNIISNQAEEIYKAQKHIGEALSDNYISEKVVDERRVRSSGATDRLVNENAYLIERVSRKPTKSGLIFKTLKYNADTILDRHGYMPNYPISLQEEGVAEEEISLYSEGNSFKGYLISLYNKNVIKVTRIKHIKGDDVEDCDGNIGTEYEIGLYKYSMQDNRYDPELSFADHSLESNQILLSEFGNIDEPVVGDKFIISYLYRDLGIDINEDSLEVYNLKEVSAESVPSNTTRFFLGNAPIVDDNNEIPETGWVSFRIGENNSEAPNSFQVEMVANASKVPSRPGEYSVDYRTGEVIVVGSDSIGEGTGSYNNIATYLYRNKFSKNLDFYIKDSELVAARDREIVGSEVKIEFNYDKVYVEGVDYNAPCHKEVFNEPVANNYASSFVISPQNTPVTNVFRIFNQSTGEVYSPLYFTDDEIYFSGRRSPEFKDSNSEVAQFGLAELERLQPSGEFVCPSFTVTIATSLSNSNIQFSPGIPEELINSISQDYFIRSKGLSGDDSPSDLQIKFFGEPDSEGLISSMAINTAAQPPSVREEVTIGPKGLVLNLEQEQLIGRTEDSVGSHVNTSVEFSKEDIFISEKYYKPLLRSSSVERVEAGSIKAELKHDDGVFFDNISRLRKPGDYSVDYKNGKIYLAISSGQDYVLGDVSYRYGAIQTANGNIIATTESSKKISSADTAQEAEILYAFPENTATNIFIRDLEDSLTLPEDGVVRLDENGAFQNICQVLEDYTVLAPRNITDVNGIFTMDTLFGGNLGSDLKENRAAELSSYDAVRPVAEGGGNLYDARFMSFEENVIDLKKEYKTRVYVNSGFFNIDLLSIDVSDENFESLYDVTLVETGEPLFDEKLNIIKKPGISIVHCAESPGEVVVSIASGTDLGSIDSYSDYIIDSSGARFSVLSVDPELSTIKVASPADNNAESISPELGTADIVVKVIVEESDDGVVIKIPSDSFLNSLDLVSVRYITKGVPEPGSDVALDFRSGKVYVRYTYSYDDLYVSYEYGDNQINWSVGNSIYEGDEYYVSYRYGALRDALRKNFGILTKIPFFQKFSETTDRELYRSALAGTMQAFSAGPTLDSFDKLVESFTDISPEITESAFGSWILGRDSLNPEEVAVDGSIDFRSCKFNEGLVVGEDTVVSMPSVSNINLDEGTFSAWISPEWAGIDNDANLEISLDNIGIKEYRYKAGSDPFDYNNGFSVLSSDDTIGGTDSSSPSITFHNFTRIWNNDEEEEDVIGAFALTKKEPAINRAIKTELNISMKVLEFSAPSAINPPRRRPAEDIPFNRSNLGLLGLGASLTDASRGLIVAGMEMDLFRYCSPAFISMGDMEKLFFAMFSMRPLYNPKSGRIYTFRVGYDNIESNDLPKYDRLHITRGCDCSVLDTINELSSFRDKDFQTIRIDLDELVDFSYIEETDVVLNPRPSVFRLVDTRGAIFEVYAFIDEYGAIVYDATPKSVSGFLVNRIPENEQFLTAQGSEAINSKMPTGEITVLYQGMSILTNNASDSEAAFEYKPRHYVVDWMSSYLDVSILRDPAENKVTISLLDSSMSDPGEIRLFYTDLIDVSSEGILFEQLNLDKWFNVANGVIDVDNANTLSDKIAVGTLDRTSKSIIDVSKIKYYIHNRFNKEDIYIGKNARNPARIPFSINKYDHPKISSGLPFNADIDEGIFIGLDELCLSPLSEDAGQWVFRTRAASSVSLPVGVSFSENGYENIYSLIPLEHVFSGMVGTDGEFSSVVRAHREEDGEGCPSGLVCASEFRYCGNGLLEESGWRKINETSSDMINVLIGGSEGESSIWMKKGDFETTSDGGIYRAGPTTSISDDINYKNEYGSVLYTSLPCYGGDYLAATSFRVIETDYRAKDGLHNRFSGSISGYLSGITPLHIYDGEISIKIMLGISDYNQPVVLIADGFTLEILDIAFFEWNNGLFSYLSVTKSLDGRSISVESDSEILSRIQISEFEEGSEDKCALMHEPFLAIHLFDGSVLDNAVYHKEYDGNIVDISLIEYSSRYEEGVNTLESNDVLISTDSKIEFSFKTDPYDIPPPNRIISSQAFVTSSRGITCEDTETIFERIEGSDRTAKLFGAYKWTAFDGTIPAGKYGENQEEVTQLLLKMGCNLYAHSCAEGVSPAVEAAGEAFYYGNQTSDDDSDPLLEAGNFEVVYDTDSGYETLSAWDEFLDLLEQTKDTGIKILASSGEKHHLRSTKDNGDGTYVVYPDRWGMHKYSTPEESRDSLILRMRELATLTLPESEGGLGYDHLIGLLHDDTSNQIGIGFNYPGEYDFGYTPEEIGAIAHAATDINPNFKFVPTMYYQRFGALLSRDGIELGCKTNVDGIAVNLSAGAAGTEYGDPTGPEGSSAYFTFERPEPEGPVTLSFAYQNAAWRPQDEEGEAHYDTFVERASKVSTDCFVNGVLVFSENLNRDNLVSFFETEDIYPHLTAGSNQIEFRMWNNLLPGESIGYLPKGVSFWDFDLSVGGQTVEGALSAPTFWANDKSLMHGFIPSTKMFARSNDVKTVYDSLNAVSIVFPKNLTGPSEDHERSNYVRVLEMARRHIGNMPFIEQERAYAWGSPVDPEIFEMKIDEASKIADGILVYNIVIETIRQEDSKGVFQDPNTELELQYSKIAWTPINYEPKNGYFREWTTSTELSGIVTFDIFIPHLYGASGKYDFFIYDDLDNLLYSGHNGTSDIGVAKHDVGYGYGVGALDDDGIIQPIVLDLASPTKLRLLWKVKDTYGGLYNFLKFRIVLGEMSRDYFGAGKIYDELSPTYVYDDDGIQLEVYPRDSYTYSAGLDLESEEEYSYMSIINIMSSIYKNVLSDKVVYYGETSTVCYDAYSDGYIDGYLDGYIDGYFGVDLEYDVDEMYFTSDKLRYVFDTGDQGTNNRMSMFKDGKGFLNFRVYDNSMDVKGDVGMFNIATNIKHFRPGEVHHVAASWRLNTIYEKDEMHLFVDGLEAPNIYRFGGSVPVRINDKFSDVSKEVLQDFLTDNITYYDTYTDGTILAGTSVFYSEQAGFTEDMVGRSIIFKDSVVADAYIGKEYIINSVFENGVTFVSGGNLDIVTFDASASDISFTFPPSAGLSDKVATDLRNEKFAIFRTDCNGNSEELGGTLYSVEEGSISIVSSGNVSNPKFRANVGSGVIEFVGQDANCAYDSTVAFSDLNIHLETFGLLFQRVNQDISLSSSSYYVLDKKSLDVNSGKSILMTHAAEPVHLKDVEIRRIVKPRFIPTVDTMTSQGEVYNAIFSSEIGNDMGEANISSESGQVYKQNMGRYLTVNFDSDNVSFCEIGIDGYLDGYGEFEPEGYFSPNKVVVYGETVDGVGYEEFLVAGNGPIKGTKLFKSVSRIDGNLLIIDPYYEPCVIELVESDLITEVNNGGEYAEILRYSAGSFEITTAGTSGFYPFELHPGSYRLSYPAYLNVNIPQAGDKLFLGCDMNGESQLKGTVEECRVITEMSSDTRPTESDTSGTRSITVDYVNPNPLCPDGQTLALIHFDNPIKLQARRLRQKEFLNTTSNFKYRLDLSDRELLLKYINNQEMFESAMIRMGFDKERALETYVECHHAEGGPLFNESRLIRTQDMNVGSSSVNDDFGLSGRFFNTPPMIISNRMSYFRRDEGTIEFWVSPLLDTVIDEDERYYADIYSAERKRVKCFSSTKIILEDSIKEVVSIRLLENRAEFSEFYTQDEVDSILFDEIHRSNITGRLTGGSGVRKDFSLGADLSADGKKITLRDALPGSDVDVLITYIPKDSNGDRISIYKNSDSQMVFEIRASGITNRIAKDIDWNRNTWHRVKCMYKANSDSDAMRLFIDGEDSGHILYGDGGLLYGTGLSYGQLLTDSSPASVVSHKISLKDDFRLICVGSSCSEDKTALARIDNVRFSRIMRDMNKDPAGNYIDTNYSPNIETILPVIGDSVTTLLINFDKEDADDQYATIIDPKGGIFNFDIEVLDNFGKINSDEVEDLIVELVNRLKPAHTNALVKFPRESC